MLPYQTLTPIFLVMLRAAEIVVNAEAIGEIILLAQPEMQCTPLVRIFYPGGGKVTWLINGNSSNAPYN